LEKGSVGGAERKTRARHTHKALGRETRDTTAANNSRRRTLPA